MICSKNKKNCLSITNSYTNYEPVFELKLRTRITEFCIVNLQFYFGYTLRPCRREPKLRIPKEVTPLVDPPRQGGAGRNTFTKYKYLLLILRHFLSMFNFWKLEVNQKSKELNKKVLGFLSFN